ncbi:MAG: hypothetical protein COA84_13380 [Robiginitomaculum sp.]|nr:MAG: hypothetical protein COA84_13380 [Robiginitomaculum sp.]
MNKTLKIFKHRPYAQIPEYSTDLAACFDLRACLEEGSTLTYYTEENVKSSRVIGGFQAVTLYSYERILIPTGLIFDLCPDQSMRIHNRSSIPWKHGVILCNAQGIIDADYTNETFIMLQNLSTDPFEICHGDRIAQAEIVETIQVSMAEITEAPTQKGNRTGGHGSTGRK